MNHYNNTTRFFAALLSVGGLLGVAIGVTVGFQVVSRNLLGIVPMGLLVALFAWATFTGFRLWQGTPYGRRWAPILFASQIPVLALPGMSYEWFTGLQFAPILRFGAEPAYLHFAINVGGGGNIYLGTGVVESGLGVNLFALVALLMLRRSLNRFATPAVEVA